MAHLQVKIINSLGTFEGKITLAANATVDEANKTLHNLVTEINNIELLSIETVDKEAVIFSQDVLKQSVVIAKVEE